MGRTRPRIGLRGLLARPRVAAILATLVLITPARPLRAQLRPLDAVEWRDFSTRHGSAFVGLSAYRAHPATLTGTEGLLLELGVFDLTARFGRVVVQATGSVYRAYEETSSIGPPAPFVQPADDGRRHDLGDYELSTAIRFREGAPALDGALRFGVRLPTTDERVGLERDQTDFFVTIVGRYQRGRLGIQMEGGLGVYGVAGSRFDQTDPWLYMLGIDYEPGRLSSSIQLVGRYDTREHGPPLGNERLAELRFGLRTVGRSWIEATAFRGISTYSPEFGLELRVGRGF